MARKADVKGGNGDVVFDAETGTARKYLRNTSTAEKVTRFKRELAVFQELCKNPIPNVVEVTDVYIDEDKIAESYVEMKKYDGSVSPQTQRPVFPARDMLCENPPTCG